MGDRVHGYLNRRLSCPGQEKPALILNVNDLKSKLLVQDSFIIEPVSLSQEFRNRGACRKEKGF